MLKESTGAKGVTGFGLMEGGGIESWSGQHQ